MFEPQHAQRALNADTLDEPRRQLVKVAKIALAEIVEILLRVRGGIPVPGPFEALEELQGVHGV